jgi:hypothetical protein
MSTTDEQLIRYHTTADDPQDFFYGTLGRERPEPFMGEVPVLQPGRYSFVGGVFRRVCDVCGADTPVATHVGQNG